jgi:hypothetical protein
VRRPKKPIAIVPTTRSPASKRLRHQRRTRRSSLRFMQRSRATTSSNTVAHSAYWPKSSPRVDFRAAPRRSLQPVRLEPTITNWPVESRLPTALPFRHSTASFERRAWSNKCLDHTVRLCERQFQCKVWSFHRDQTLTCPKSASSLSP